MIYVVSDLHLEHGNIIEYCDRPFESVGEMNRTLVENWNDVVGPNDTVLFLGDLVPFEDREHVVLNWLDELEGTIVFVEGNHDEAIPITSHEFLTYETTNVDLYLTHYPRDIPDDWNGWGIYGHHHNNDVERYPFVDPAKRRINASVELVGFEPVPIPELVGYIEEKRHLVVRPGTEREDALQSSL
ncbi:metallophosphoesterase [Natronoglomus mannanivorans]|uniref:Metallophosphoesterase n=1 Tax=Natronoglomus mannanivorans TaxID=2979990 RepID=A0AAP2Z3E8_9EURY|nr:metallophosphoesterase [Halobacteria archaeon AArc-xg1-1]